MQRELEATKRHFCLELSQVTSSKSLAELRVRYLGRKSVFRRFAEHLKEMSAEEKASAGELINSCKEYIENCIHQRMETLLAMEEEANFRQESVDITLPGEMRSFGGKHVLKQVLDEVVDLFVHLGFCVREAPNIESEANNFTLLNFEEDHPARQMHDTFYLDPTTVLRTHTSNVQAREISRQSPPIKVVAPGVCFRNEDISARAHVLFHQVEAFYIDDCVTLSDLTEMLVAFYHMFFGRKVELRLRHSYFPFVEPGIEVDVSCECHGAGCVLCKHTGWLEVAGAGMVHPRVLLGGGIDPERYSGYALGMGVERLAMLRYGISDIRLFSENDIRFLQQFV